ncbi:hypothetical protein K501DRAFT_271108 [Backusella circina FSU 941]|nr:hypothetical protein K501DRAFT_271108 [Backusella circina FSU 941]
MTGCYPLFCIGNIKHATLVNNCYPLKQSSNLPKSSDLSYLTFYASSKPAKLTKVGSYLEKTVLRDIRKGRKANNQVSLHILKALIQACHRDLNIFSKYVVRILSEMLDTKDIELIDLSCETFITFCSYHEGSTLGVDSEFTNDYEDLLKKWVDFCIYTKESSIQLQVRYIGHRAVQAAVTSGALQSSDFKVQSSILFPPLISTLAASDQSIDMLETGGTVDIRESALNNGDMNMKMIEQVAAHTISVLFSKVTGPLVRLSFSLLFGYVDDKKAWWPPQLVVTIVKVILDSLQPQYRYLLVSDILHQLDDSSSSNDESKTKKNAALVIVLDTVLNANIPLVGISVLEVLNSLFALLIKQHKKTENEEEKEVSEKLVHSIGGLASQTYYDNQLNDVISYLVSKLRVNTPLENVDGVDLYQYRMVVLNCLESVVDKSVKANDSDNSDSFIPLDAWTPSLGLLCDKNKWTRIAFCLTFSHFLQNMVTRSTLVDESPAHNLSHHRDAKFVDRFFQILLEWTQIPDFNKTDLQLFYSLLSLFTRKIGVDAIVASVPFVFKLQNTIKNNNDDSFEKQQGIESIILSWFNIVAQIYSIQSLQVYINQLQADNHLPQQTESINLSSSANNSHLLTKPDEFGNNSTPVKYWIDRNEVVEQMSKNGTMLRDQNDTHGLELEAKLYTEWGSDSLVKNDHTTARHRITQEGNEIKPKLESPWIRSSIQAHPTGHENKKNSIRVSHLKEALVPQTISDDDELDSDSTQSIAVSARSKPRTDMHALLSELNVPNIEKRQRIKIHTK